MSARDSNGSSRQDSGLLHRLEPLEPRKLLTTLIGGDVFQYTDVNGQTIRIGVDGDAIVEIIGAKTDGTNTLIGDMPGQFIDSATTRTDFQYLVDGVELIGLTSITDDDFVPGTTVATDTDGDFSSEINLQGLASQSATNGSGTYAFNLAEFALADDATMAQLVRLSHADGAGTVQAMLHNATLGHDEVADLTGDPLGVNPSDLAVNPITGLLYAVTETGGESVLHEINRRTGSVTTIGTITSGGSPLTGIAAIGFDAAGDLFALDQRPGAAPADPNDAFLIQDIDLGTAVAAGETQLDFLGANEEPRNYLAMTFDPVGGGILAIAQDTAADDSTSRLHRINDVNGEVDVIGAVQVGDANARIDGMQFVVDASGDRILVGLDNGQVDDDTGLVNPRLAIISTVNGNATPLSESGAGSTVNGLFRGLAAFEESAGQFVLYANNADTLFRGSAVTLPTSAEDGASLVQAIPAADFRPNTGEAEDGLLYFVVTFEVDDDVFHDVYTIDATAANRSAVQSSMQRVGRIDGLTGDNAAVNSIAWDQTAADDSRLLISVVTTVDGADQGQILEWDGDTPFATGVVQTLNFAGTPVTNLTGIELLNDDPTVAEETIFGVTGPDGDLANQVLRIDLTNGGVTPFGSTQDADDTDAPIRGLNLQGLSWNPSLIDPFTGTVGAMLATDASSDELVFVDTRFRSADELFSIYVSQASEDANIWVSAVHIPDGDPPVLVPFNGVDVLNEQGNNSVIETTDDRFDLRVTDTEGETVIIDFNQGVGGVYIGARQLVPRTPGADEVEPLEPVIDASLGQRLGVFASGIDLSPDNDTDNVSAGVFVAPGLLNYFSGENELVDRLFGMNLDRISSIALDDAGNITVIDTDRFDPNGDPTGAELSLIDPVTGIATETVNIVDSATLNPIFNISAADWADLNFDGNPQLFAVAEIDNPNPVDRSGDGVGGDLLAEFDFQGFAVSPSGIAFGVHDNAGVLELIRVDRTPAGGVDAVTTVGRLVVEDATDPIGFSDMTSVEAMGFDPVTGDLVIIGDNADADRALFILNQNPVDIDGDAAAEELIAIELALLPGAEPFRDVAFSSAGELFAVRGADGNPHNLVQIDPADGMVVDLGTIQVAGTDAVVDGVGFDQFGQLLAVDRSAPAGTGRIILVDQAVPADSQPVTDPNTVSADLVGYASDITGLFYGVEQVGGSNSELFVSTGVAPVLGTIAFTAGDPQAVFTVATTLDPAVQDAGVRDIAFAPFFGDGTGVQGLFIVGGDNELYEVNPTDGSVVSGGDTLQDSDGNPVQITKIVFNANGTTLYGHDPENARLVDIDLADIGTGTLTVGDEVATENGTLRPSIGGLAYDFANDRFLVADNATSAIAPGQFFDDLTDPLFPIPGDSAALYVLSGLTDSAPTAQHFGNAFIGGRMTGRADFSGSLDSFYAGSMLTGQTIGQFQGAPTLPGNFNVAGDLYNLVSGSSVGTNQGVTTETPYFTGFDLIVGGRLGMVRAHDSFVGTYTVENFADAPGFSGRPYRELEGRGPDAGTVQSNWLEYRLFDGTERFFNDSQPTAQRLGSIRSAIAGNPDVISVDGVLNTEGGDPLDHYAVALLAGQTVEVQVTSTLFTPSLAVYDPDGRLIASTYNISGSLPDTPFRFTADRPGEYRFVIGEPGEADFDPAVTAPASEFPFDYNLTIRDAGDLAMAGLVADNNILSVALDMDSFLVNRGDLGAITSLAGDLYLNTFPSTADIHVVNGNLRSVSAQSISEFGGLIVAAPSVATPNGSIGLMQGRDPAGGVYFSTSTVPPLSTQSTLDNSALVGENVQVIDSAGGFGGIISVNGNIGNVRAGSMTVLGGFTSTFLRANADNTNDGTGVIDLIDVAGDFGTLAGGGPGIHTGFGGDVRYIRVGGEIFQDTKFQGGGFAPLPLAPGESYQHTDDGGGEFVVSPGSVENPDFDPNLPEDPIFNPRFDRAGALTITQYGIRTGGSVLIDVTSSDLGVTIDSSNSPSNAPVQVSQVTLLGSGRGVTPVDADDILAGIELNPDAGEEDDVEVRFVGPLRTDVLNIVGQNIARIVNQTGGELVTIQADDVGEIISQATVGLAWNHTGAAVNPQTVLSDVFPFNQQSIGVVAANVALVRAHMGVGNLILSGDLGELIADSDGQDVADAFEGINAPIFSAGNLLKIRIGEGVAPTGTGNFAHAGIYGNGIIDRIIGVDADIRGNIISTGDAALAAEGVINRIELSDGSIINAYVGVLEELNMSRAIPIPTLIPTLDGRMEIGQVNLSGDGGIIGSLFDGHNIGDFTVSRGYGILNSAFTSIGNGTIGDIRVDGYGLIGDSFLAPTELSSLTATGDGRMTPLSAFSPTARFSDMGLLYDPIFNTRLTGLTDLSIAMAAQVLREGQIMDTTATGLGTAGDIEAYRIGGSNPMNATTLDFAGGIDSIQTDAPQPADPNQNTIDRLFVTTGELGKFGPGGDVSDLVLNVAGELKKIKIDGNMLGSSAINATGPNGEIGKVDIGGMLVGSIFSNTAIKKVDVGGDMTGSITANRDVGKVSIDGDLVGDVTVNGTGVDSGDLLKALDIVGDFLGSMSVAGDVGKMTVGGTLGNPGDVLLIAGNLKALQVGDSKSLAADQLVADVLVEGHVSKFDVVGSVLGQITVLGNLDNFSVTAHPTALGGVLLNSNVSVGGEAGKLEFEGGSVGDGGGSDFALTVMNSIGQMSITDGDLAGNYTVESLNGNIDKFEIDNGDLNGTLLADNGMIGQVDVSGSDLAGSIIAAAAGKLSFDGSLLATAVINIASIADELSVGADVLAGAQLMFGGIEKLGVEGNFAALLDSGYVDKGTSFEVGGNLDLAADVSIDADADIEVGGNVTDSGGLLWVGRWLDSFAVDGSAAMQLIVGAAMDSFSAMSLADSVITTGFGIDKFEVDNAVTNTLVQAGSSPGEDRQFAAVADDVDAGETSRMARIGSIDVGSMTNAIFAAGGLIEQLASGTMTDSSVLAGFALGSNAIRGVIDDATPLDSVAEINAARGGADRAIYHGNIDKAEIDGAGLTGASVLAAGVDPGAAGDFAAPSVVASMTGGTSRIGQLDGVRGGASLVITDAGIDKDNSTGAGTLQQVNYTIANLTTDQGNALQGSQGVATDGAPLVINAVPGALTIEVTGDGNVEVFDDNPDDGVIDAIVFTGTNDGTQVTITGGGNYDIARLLTADNATAKSIVFDGDLVGDGTDAPDLWIDGPIDEFTFVDLGGDWTGRIGGGVGDLTMNDQGSGRFRIGGRVDTLGIASSLSNPLLDQLGTYANSVYNTLTVDGAGDFWAHIGNGELHRLNPGNDNDVLQTVNVTDMYSGNAVSLLGLDFRGADLFAAGRLYDPQPTQEIGGMNSAGNLRGLAVNAAGEVFAIDTINVSGEDRDHLVQIDPATGEATVIGELRDFIAQLGGSIFDGDILATTFDNQGRLIALVSSRDGEGPAADEAALVQIELTPNADGELAVHRIGQPNLQGVVLGGGGITDAFTGLAVAGDDTIYAIQRVGGTDDHLVSIATDGTITDLGAVQIDAGGAGITQIMGIGFDADDNLVAFDNDGASAGLIYLSPADLTGGNPDQFRELTDEALINPDLDVFAFGQGGGGLSHFRTFAYDAAGAGTFFTNPIDPADAEGRVLVLGTIDTGTGAFQRLLTVADDGGEPVLVPADQNLPLAADSAIGSDDLFFVAPGDNGPELIRYEVTTGTFTVVGDVVDSVGNPVDVTAIDFDGSDAMIGLDGGDRRVVLIDTATGEVSARTDGSTVDGDATDLTFDPVLGEFFTFIADPLTPADNHFASLKGTTDDAVGGIVASGVDNLELGAGPFNGRIVATGNTFDDVEIEGDFFGSLVSAGNINKLAHSGANFGGTLSAAFDIEQAELNGQVLENAQIRAGYIIDKFDHAGGDFGGYLNAMIANQIDLGGDVLDGAMLSIDRLDKFENAGDFNGAGTFGTVYSDLAIGGMLGAGAALHVTGNADTIEIEGGTDATSTVRVDGYLSDLGFDGTHAGRVDVGNWLDSAQFNHVNGGRLFVNSYGNQLKVDGDSTNGAFIYGIDLGADRMFNSADDVIRGGWLDSADFKGDYADTILAAGALPAASSGPGLPADHRAFLRTANGVVTHATEAGGLQRSWIGSVKIDTAVTSSPTNQSLIATADGVEDLSVKNNPSQLIAQTHDDPFGAPSFVGLSQPADNQIRIVLSEPVNTESLRISTVIGDDGTIILTQDGQVVSGLTVSYTEQITVEGVRQGVITITRDVPFDDAGGPLLLTLDGDGADPIVDRSGLRSLLIDVGDLPQTRFNGGDDFSAVLPVGDAPDDFDDPMPFVVPLMVDNVVPVFSTFETAGDVDVIGFAGNAGEFFSVDYDGGQSASIGVFLLDDQGTMDPADDTHELVAMWENSSEDAAMFQAFELPETGDYFVAVAPDFFIGDPQPYSLQMTLASSDNMLATLTGGTLTAGPTAEQLDFGGGNVQDIAYVTNAERVSKQLVYLDFDGGIFESGFNFLGGDVPVGALEAGDLDPMLLGMTDELIFGNGGTVDGILNDVQSILTGFPAEIGSVTVGLLGADLTSFLAAGTGVYFTTEDPAATSGLDPDADFTTIFIGPAGDDLGEAGLFGIASDIDVAGLNLADQAGVFTDLMGGESDAVTTTALLNQYSSLLANVIAHELLHTMGFNHQPTNFVDYQLIEDNPDNMGGTPLWGGAGTYGIMAYAPGSVLLNQLGQLGTADLAEDEFPVGQLDTADLFVRWFS